jgi:hypothetical protein
MARSKTSSRSPTRGKTDGRDAAAVKDDNPLGESGSDERGLTGLPFPTDILLEICDHLAQPSHIYNLALCLRALWATLQHNLYRSDVLHELQGNGERLLSFDPLRSDTALMWAARCGNLFTAMAAIVAINTFGSSTNRGVSARDMMLNNTYRSAHHSVCSLGTGRQCLGV